MSGILCNETLKLIEAELGRPLRVLHIGNIANNAYNNARIQRQYGIEADVLSYDYYHVMSTPEWEDAQFEGTVDADAPNWWGTSLKGWKRPEWFVQGPATTCLQYLRAKRFGYGRLQHLLWRALEALCLGQVRYVAKLAGKPLQPMSLRLALALKAAQGFGVAGGPAHRVSLEAVSELLALKTSAGETLFPIDEHDAGSDILLPPKSLSIAVSVRRRAFSRLGRWLTLPFRIVSGIAFDLLVRDGLADSSSPRRLSPLWLAWRRRQRPGVEHRALIEEVENRVSGAELLHSSVLIAKRFPLRAARSVWMHVRSDLIRLLHVLAVYIQKDARSEVEKISAYNSSVTTTERDRRFVDLINSNLSEFERVPTKERNTFLVYYSIFGAQFVDIFGLYDIVQCYAVDGCLCAVNGFEHYLSYEHGTLRDLPFGDDFYGVVTRLSYHASTYVFVTNSDVLPSVDRMGLDAARAVCLPHAFDDKKLIRFRAENPSLAPPTGVPVIFSPTRQHWKDKSGSWTKGNDVLFRAAARLATEGQDFRLHLVEWGMEIGDSKALIAELGIAEKVVWLPTMQKRELWEAYCTAHAVADQFILPALGGVGFETMALGRRLITALDDAQLTHFFGEAPPCLSASTVEECAAQLRRVIADPRDEAGLGAAAQRWMQMYHSAERIVDIQAMTYRRFLEAKAPTCRTASR